MPKRVGTGGARFERAPTSRSRLLWFRYVFVTVGTVLEVLLTVVGGGYGDVGVLVVVDVVVVN